MAYTDAELDDMHHALGRPMGPQIVPYRNYFVLDADCAQAARMRSSTGWQEGKPMNGGRDAVFCVTDEGIRAVWPWLAAKDRAAGLKLFCVTGNGLSTRHIRAKSRSAARYKAYLAADFSCLTFGEYVSEFSPRAVLA